MAPGWKATRSGVVQRSNPILVQGREASICPRRTPLCGFREHAGLGRRLESGRAAVGFRECGSYRAPVATGRHCRTRLRGSQFRSPMRLLESRRHTTRFRRVRWRNQGMEYRRHARTALERPQPRRKGRSVESRWHAHCLRMRRGDGADLVVRWNRRPSRPET